MTNQKHPIPPAEFDAIFAKVPRLTVEVIIRTSQGIALAKLPLKYKQREQWCLPGGTVRFGESLTTAVRRVAKDELGVIVDAGKLLGYIEYPSLLKAGYRGWPVGIAFEATTSRGKLTVDDEGEPVQCFREIPQNTQREQSMFLIKYLKENPYGLGPVYLSR